MIKESGAHLKEMKNKKTVSGLLYLRTGHESDYGVSGGIDYIFTQP